MRLRKRLLCCLLQLEVSFDALHWPPLLQSAAVGTADSRANPSRLVGLPAEGSVTRSQNKQSGQQPPTSAVTSQQKLCPRLHNYSMRLTGVNLKLVSSVAARLVACHFGPRFLLLMLLAGANILLLAHNMSTLQNVGRGTSEFQLQSTQKDHVPLSHDSQESTLTAAALTLSRGKFSSATSVAVDSMWKLDDIKAPVSLAPRTETSMGLWERDVLAIPRQASSESAPHGSTATANVQVPHPSLGASQKEGTLKLFPLVQYQEVEGGCCIALHSQVRVIPAINLFESSPVLRRAAVRAEQTLRRLSSKNDDRKYAATAERHRWTIVAVHINLSLGGSLDERLHPESSRAYTISCEANSTRSNASGTEAQHHNRSRREGVCMIEADGIYGAVTALESTMVQLFADFGEAPFQKLLVKDWPAYPVRGLMVDTGRRFIPKDVLQREIINGMALVRMNLLQLHLSDYCRFALDLPGFPELNRSLKNGVLEGQYSTQDVGDLIAYARDRGISILPEVDLPGHADCLLPLEARGMGFCKPPPGSKPRPEETVQVWDDSAWLSRKVLRGLVSETARAFGTELGWFHIGGDEANPSGKCSKRSIVDLEALDRKSVV